MHRPDPFRSSPGTNFSAGYTLITGVDVETWTDDEAAMPRDLWLLLAEEFGEPLVGRVGHLHYHFDVQKGIPSRTVAVPQHNHKAVEPDELLIQA